MRAARSRDHPLLPPSTISFITFSIRQRVSFFSAVFGVLMLLLFDHVCFGGSAKDNGAGYGAQEPLENCGQCVHRKEQTRPRYGLDEHRLDKIIHQTGGGR